MAITVKTNADLLVPASVQRRAGIKIGDRVQFKVSRGVITIVSAPSRTGSNGTPAQRRAIDRELAKGLADIKAGRITGPFETGTDLLNSLHAEAKTLQAGKANRRRK